MPDFRSSPAVYAGTWDSIREHFAAGTLVNRLPRYTGPALFVHGERSPIPPIESEKSASLIEGAQLEVVRGAGHFPWFERPSSVAGPVGAFV
jgi:pimeloyl-ACP methyl ester carboxylesterase